MIELEPTNIAHGGEAVARVDGKAHFVDGAMPGERVSGEVVRDGGAWARVELRQVLQASPHRVEPPCPHFGVCGGCQWQFADYPTQLEWKRDILAGQLSHLGRVAVPPMRKTVVAGEPWKYRNRADFDVIEGRPAFHRRRSHTLEPIDHCLLLDERLAELHRRLGDLTGVRRLTLRVAASTGELLAVVTGAVPVQAAGWRCGLVQRRSSELSPLRGSGSVVETVAGVEFRISADAFFQNNTPGAEALILLVAEALAPQQSETMLDGYSGGGLFGLTVGRSAGRVVAVESDPLALGDLRHNAAGFGGEHRVVADRFEVAQIGWRWDVAVVDPPRDGLGAAGVEAVTRGRPRAIAYVSCDPASLARDCRHLAVAGYRLDWATPVDMFPQTFHIETVAAFTVR